MRSICRLAIVIVGLSLPLSAAQADQWRVVPTSDLSSMLDCFEEKGASLISAHRGGPSPGLPENAIETMDAVLTAIPAIMEVDVAQSADGELFLMHDDTLDRTTTGTGAAGEARWADLAALRLTDSAGWVTPYAIPTLAKALDWAKGRTVLQLDFKRSTNRAEVIELVRAKGMGESVILIAYSQAQAVELHRLAPEMLISYSIDALGELEAIVAAGVPANRIVAFTGTRLARPDLYRMLDDEDVEVIFGTLGRPDRSLDGVFARMGTDERYTELSEGGVDIIATDRPREAAAALAAKGRLPEVGVCGVERGGE